MRKVFLSLGLIALVGCAGPQKVAGPSPEFAPIIPVATNESSIPTGSLYNAAYSDSWFGEKKAYRVGDIVTVVLDESLDADTTTKNTASRKTKLMSCHRYRLQSGEAQADFCRMTSKRKTKYRQLDPA